MYTNEAKRFKACSEIERIFEEVYKNYYMCLNCFQPYNVKKHGTMSATFDADDADHPRKARDSLNESSLMKFDDDVAEAQEEDQVLQLKKENEALKQRIKVLEARSESYQAFQSFGENS